MFNSSSAYSKATHLYNAPEIINSATSHTIIDHVRADIWSLGTILYEMVTNNQAFYEIEDF